ncbi:YhaN family protein [Aquibium sp. ELW1220]|uniref:ATP-binding protein n=1 Tax=Aquibium sp. ELW1220 TaxID=2976766 RepID=UPI0025B0FBD5|nr:YhaN family protein [Aquibium sp. ELW1220]MDN2582148.1 AAA family ATPase [Aquibium sp. ELW1220]
MRFNALHFMRYGSLTDRTLQLRPDAKLHIVFGPNEAGKSSALAAITDLLFGFAAKKEFSFLHDAATLRVGAEVISRDGASLSFRRRRGNKNTLLSATAEETPLHDDALSPFLGSLRRETFKRAFGLDSARLRQGAAEMLRSDGELGSMLFAAASGLLGLTSMRAKLEEEADAIFTKRASASRRFYQIQARHEEARRRERDSELRSADWKTHVAALEEVTQSTVATKAMRVETSGQIKHLSRLRQLQPALDEMDEATRDLDAFADIAALPTDLADRLSERLAECAASDSAATTAAKNENDLGEALAGIVVDSALLADAAAITALFAQTTDFTSKQRDLPRILAEENDYRDRIGQLIRRIGLREDSNADALQPSDPALALVNELVDEGRELADQIRALNNAINAERRTREELQRSQQSAALIDPKPWRDRVAALSVDLKSVEAIGDLVKRRTALLRSVEEHAVRLTPPVHDLTRLAACPLPSVAMLARHRIALADIADRTRDTSATLKTLTEESRRLEAQIAELEISGPISSVESIAEARAARDSGFDQLRRALLGETHAQNAPSDLSAYQSLVAEVDRLVDLWIADSQRGTQHATAMIRRSALDVEIAARGAELSLQAAEMADARSHYEAEFSAAGIAPGTPADMEAWVQRVAGLLDERRAAEALADDVAVLTDREAALTPALIEISRGIALEAGSLPTQALARAIDAKLTSLADAWTEGRTIEGKRQEAVRRLEQLEADLADAIVRQNDWAVNYHAALLPIGLDVETTMDQAIVALKAWREYPDLVHERDNRGRRVKGMQRDTTAFLQAAQDLAARHAPDLQALPADRLADSLRERLQAAQQAKVKHEATGAALAKATSELAAARQRNENASSALSELTAVLPKETDPAALVTRLRARDSLRANLIEARRRFHTLADGQDEIIARLDLAGFDRTAAQVDITRLELEHDRLVKQLGEDAAREAELLMTQRRHEASEGSELAALQRHSAEVEIVDVARHWAVLKLASTMLGAAMEKHRQTQADPLLQRAGALFAILSGGSFARLTQEFGDDDQPELRGERPGGERVSIVGMSDGTVDQLYLALRMAYLEEYASRNEPAPFIGDDIFQTFDDERATAGLVALAQMSATIQPILFTHERSVVELGGAALGADLDVIDL